MCERMKRPFHGFSRLFERQQPYARPMRIVLGWLLYESDCCAAPDRAADAIRIWNVSPMRSMDPYPTALPCGFKHTPGAVFAWDRTDAKGWITAASTILYFDGEARDYRDGTCDAIITASGSPDHRDSPEMRHGRVDSIRPTSQRAVERVDSRHQRGAFRRSRVAATPHSGRQRGHPKTGALSK
jgi:hypothetical protein